MDKCRDSRFASNLATTDFFYVFCSSLIFINIQLLACNPSYNVANSPSCFTLSSSTNLNIIGKSDHVFTV